MHRRPGELPLGDPDRSEIDLEVLAQFIGVVETVVLGPILDEEVEGIDRREVGDKTDRDRQSRRGFRKHKARLVIAERVLLPVQEVSRGLHRQRIRLDRSTRVRCRTQPHHVRIDLDRPIERVRSAVFERHLDCHRSSSRRSSSRYVPMGRNLSTDSARAPDVRSPSHPCATCVTRDHRRLFSSPVSLHPGRTRRPWASAWRRYPTPCAARR